MVSLSFVNHRCTIGSLRNTEGEPAYRVKNRLFDATFLAEWSPATLNLRTIDA